MHRYERLSPLKVATKPLHHLGNIRPGDCIVGFSRKMLFQLKREIEMQSQKSIRRAEKRAKRDKKKKQTTQTKDEQENESNKKGTMYSSSSSSSSKHQPQQPLRCCVVYGSLPPEARREQAKLFNTPHNGFDVLVASDAIGMGLNLNIQR